MSRWVRNDRDIDGDLCGACAIASYTLWRVLRAAGSDATFVSNTDGDDAHCWVEAHGHVIDITATQYGGPEVAIFRVGQIPEWGYAYSFEFKLTNRQAVEMVRLWEEQSPLRYRSKIEKLVQSIPGLLRKGVESTY